MFGRPANPVGHRRPLVLVTLATVAITLTSIPLLPGITAVIIATALLWLVVASVTPVLTMRFVDNVPESIWSKLAVFPGSGVQRSESQIHV